jgi:hypothetical protein
MSFRMRRKTSRRLPWWAVPILCVAALLVPDLAGLEFRKPKRGICLARQARGSVCSVLHAGRSFARLACCCSASLIQA